MTWLIIMIYVLDMLGSFGIVDAFTEIISPITPTMGPIMVKTSANIVKVSTSELLST